MDAVNQFVVLFRDIEVPEKIKSCESDLVQDAYVLPGDTAVLLRSPVVDISALVDPLLRYGEGEDDYHAAVILKLNGSYTGYYATSLWDWLDKGRD